MKHPSSEICPWLFGPLVMLEVYQAAMAMAAASATAAAAAAVASAATAAAEFAEWRSGNN